MVGFYFGIIRYLLFGVPLIAVALIGASYIWDVERGPSCDFSKEMLSFMGTAVKWYLPMVGATILGVPRIIALFKPSNGRSTPPPSPSNS